MKRCLSILLVLVITIGIFPAMSSFAADTVWDPFNGDEEVNIVYLGGSITLAEGWRVDVGNYIKKTYEGLVPGRKINNFNAGIGGTGSDYGVIRLERDVISKKPDLVFVEFAVNDGWPGDANDEKKAKIANAMEGIVRRLQSLPNPPMIVFVYTTGTTFKNCYDIHTKIANYYNIPEMNFLQHMLDLGFQGVSPGTPYDQLPPKLKANWKDVTHPNSDGHKIWSEYAIKELTKSPNKYFRHPQLKQNPLNRDHFGEVSAKYVTAKEAMLSGGLSVRNKSGSSGVEGKDYTYDSDGVICISGIGNKAVMNFEGNVMAPTIMVNASDSTVFTYEIDGGTIKGKGSCFYGGESCATEAALKKGKHSIEIAVSEPRPSGSNGDNIRIKGFFIATGNAVAYPAAYPENIKINVWNESAEVNPDTQEDKKSEHQKEIDFVTALGIMHEYEDKTFKPDGNVTRADFAQMISTIYKIGGEGDLSRWYAGFYAHDDDNTVKAPAAVKQDRYSDVDSDYWAAEIIEAVAANGLMSGVTETEFDPDRDISVNEAVKTMVDVLGYKVKAELKGGYPDGYTMVAVELGLLKGISTSGLQQIKRGEMARLVYNALDVELLQTEGVGEDIHYKTFKDETLLTKVMELNKITGVVTDNGITSLTDKSSIGKKRIKVEEEVFELSEKSIYAKDFIGRNVEVYYSYDKNESIHTVVYARLSGNDSAIRFNISDFVSFSGNEIEYDEKEETKSAHFTVAPYMIYNGLALKSFDESIFHADSGNVTLISSNSSNKYDTILLNTYLSWCVGNIDRDNSILYNKAADNNPETTDSTLALDFSDNDSDISILSNTMEKIDFKTIKEGNVLDISKNGNVVKIIVSSAKVENFIVDEISNDDREMTIKDGNKQYTMSKDYLKAADMINIQVGKTYNLYLNSFGKIGWVELPSTTEFLAAFLMRADKRSSGVSPMVQLKLLTDKGIVMNFRMADKAILDTQDGSSQSYKKEALYDQIKNYNGLLRYKLDADKNIKHLELPLTVAGNDREEGRLALAYDVSGTSGVYISAAQQFGPKIQINDNTKIFAFKTNAPNDDDSYKVLKRNKLVDGRQYAVKAYNMVADSPYSDIVVLNNGEADGFDPVLYKTFVVVTDVVKAVNADGDQGMKVYGFQMSTEGAASDVELFSKDDSVTNSSGSRCSAFEAATDGVGSGTLYKVAAGDIIRYALNDDNVEKAQIIYKADIVNPAFPGGHKGTLAGTVGCFDSNAAGKTNPYAINTDSTLRTGDPKTFNVGELRIIYGSVHSIYSNIIKYTTQDLSAERYDPNEGGGKYSVESVKIPSAVAAITYKNGKVKVEKGTISDIISYKNAGTKCSRVVIQARSGRVEKLFVINGEIRN